MTATIGLDRFAEVLDSPGHEPERDWRPYLVRLAAGEHLRFSVLCREHGITVLDTIDRQLAGEARYAAGQIAHVARRLLLGERLPPCHGHLDLEGAIT